MHTKKNYENPEETRCVVVGNAQMSAELVVVEGRVLTMDAQRPHAEAFAISNGRIVAVGTSSEIRPLISPKTHVVSARGKTVLPGFIESHMHLFAGASELHHLSLHGVSGFENCANAIRTYAKNNLQTKFLFGQGADYTIFPERVTRHHLDRIIPDRPFAMAAQDHHTMWANTKALELAGLLHGKVLGAGNEIVMGEDGLATGELREVEAFIPLIVLSGEHRAGLGLSTGGEPDPAPSETERALDKAMMQRGLDWCAKHGITTIHNMDGNLYQLDLLDDIRGAGNLHCRAHIPFHFKNHMQIDALEKASLMAERYTDDWLCSGKVKVFYDGVLESWTAVMAQDYADRQGWVGEPLFTEAEFANIAIEADRRKLQIAVHAIGDGAVHAVLNGYEAAQKANGRRDSRHRIEHVEVVLPGDVARFQKLGVIASMQPPHPPGVMDMPLEPTLSRIGREKWPLSYAWRTLKTAGAHIPFASDWPVSDINVMRGIHAAITRSKWSDDLPDQRFSLMEALGAYTLEGAYAEHGEDKKGMLKEGFFADAVILSDDIESLPPQDLQHITPQYTICGGNITYEARSL